MQNEKLKQKQSKTAFFNALHRTIAHKMNKNNKLGGDHLAEIFLPWHYRFFLKFSSIQKNTKQKLDDAFPGLNAYVTARTAFFDQLFQQALQKDIPQIIILGAGYDTRPYRFSEMNENTRIFECDTPIMQNKKKKDLKKAKIEIPEQVTFVPIDLNQVMLDLALKTAGYQSDKITLFIWEGVSYYLDPVSVDQILTFFSHSAHNDSVLAFDYTISINDDNADEYYGARSFIQSMQKEHADEALHFSLKEGEVGQYLSQKGAYLLEHYNIEEIEKRYLTDENGEIIDKITGHFRFVQVKPKA
jgi:methyltransferase (TIGR00027 family)